MRPKLNNSSCRAGSDSIGIEGIALFQGLSPHEMGRVKSVTRSVSVATKGSILREGGISDNIYFLLSGTACICRNQRDGNRLILNLIGAGETLGELCTLDALGHTASVVATEPCTLLAMSRGDFQELEESMARVSRNLKLLLVSRLRFAAILNEALTERQVRTRVALLLLALADRYTGEASQVQVPIPLRLTQNEIADWIGASRQHTEKHLRQLRDEGVLGIVEGRRLVILDRQRLRQCAN